MGNYTAVWKKFAEFEGRADRAEFWTFVLINWVIVAVLEIIGQAAGKAGIAFIVIASLFGLAALVPNLAVTWRRLHDTDRTGNWFFFVFLCGIGGLIPLILCLLPGTPGANKYGEPPAPAAA